jgi:hypothetical protein
VYDLFDTSSLAVVGGLLLTLAVLGTLASLATASG